MLLFNLQEIYKSSQIVVNVFHMCCTSWVKKKRWDLRIQNLDGTGGQST